MHKSCTENWVTEEGMSGAWGSCKVASREVLGDFAVDSGSCHQVLFDLPVVLADDHSGWLL